MDIELEKKIDEAIAQASQLSIEDFDFNQMDPVARMMLVALINESQKIQDAIGGVSERIVDRYCTDFIPYEKVGAVPAITLLNPSFKHQKNSEIVNVGTGAVFTFKTTSAKMPINYIPLFGTALLPYSGMFVLTPNQMTFTGGIRGIKMDRPNRIWVGITTKAEVDSLHGLSLLISGTNGLLPKKIYVGSEGKELDFSTMQEFEDIEMLEPFDAQQSSGQFFAFVDVWKECLQNMEDSSLIYITDEKRDRDVFKPRAYPRVFQQWLENESLECFEDNTLWLQLEFPEDYIVPDSCSVIVNVLPVVNVDVNALTLTQASPIAKLQKQDNSFFLRILETSTSSHKQGFSTLSEEVIVRDFDAVSYNNGDLYRDVRNLYNRFIDDYYAFIEYNGIKDGEVLKILRETINRLGKSVGDKNEKFKFDSGTYVMKNMNLFPQTSSTKVSYITTLGAVGNTPQAGDVMENKKLPSIEQKVAVVVPAMGGADKALADERYELLRYYSLTNDRLYTKMDIEAFLRKEIMAEFGKDEFKRIFIKISVEGAGGFSSLQRGLYIDIEFKDKKNYEKAVNTSFDKLVKQRIEIKSCITMPVMVKLINLEK